MGAHDQTIDKDARASIHDRGRTLPPIRQSEYVPDYDPVDATPIPDTGHLPIYARQAFLFRDKQLIPDTVYVHGDDFTPTEWEAQFSNLCGSEDDQCFTPVVDDNYQIIGHLGWIPGSQICVPKDTIAEYSPHAAAIQTARLRETWLRRVSSNNQMRPFLPGPRQTAPAAPTKRPDICWPANKAPTVAPMKPGEEDALLKSLDAAPGQDPSEEVRHTENMNFFLAGGGTAIVGWRFGWLLTPMDQWLKGPNKGVPYDTYLTSFYRCMVLVGPDGHIQEMLRVEEFHPESRNEKILRIALEVIDVALTIWMIIDIATIPVALFRLGGRLVAKEVMVETVKLTVDQEVKTVLDLTAREVAEGGLRRGARGAMSGPEQAAAKTAWQKLRNAFWEGGKKPPKKLLTMTKEQVETWNKTIAERMKALGIPENNIGVKVRDYNPVSGALENERPYLAGKENGEALNTHAHDMGGSMRSYRSADEWQELGISVHGNVFDDWPGFDLWNQSSIEDRIDAIIAHEWSEFNELTHWETVEAAPETNLPIRDRAREILRYMRVMGKPELAFTEFTKAEWEAIVKAGMEKGPIEEKLKIAAGVAAKAK